MAQFIFASFVIIIARQPAWHAQRDIVIPWVPTIRPSNVGVVSERFCIYVVNFSPPAMAINLVFPRTKF